MNHKKIAFGSMFIFLALLVLGGIFGLDMVRNETDGCKYLQTVNSGSDVTSLYYSFSGENSAPYCEYMANKDTIYKYSDGVVVFTYQLKSIPVSALEYSCKNTSSSGYTVEIYSNKVIGITACSLYQ